MPDDLYWDDALLWSEQQAARLRRVAAGERVNDVDWDHVIEEIEDVGRTELRACTSLLLRAIEHLCKLVLWPDDPAVPHWRIETLAFLGDARDAFTPSMRQRLDLQRLYARSLAAVRAADAGNRLADLPTPCPFDLAELLTEQIDLDALLTRLCP